MACQHRYSNISSGHVVVCSVLGWVRSTEPGYMLAAWRRKEECGQVASCLMILSDIYWVLAQFVDRSVIYAAFANLAVLEPWWPREAFGSN